MSASQVKELREKTGAGIMDCKRALTEAEGNMDKAIEILRQQGLASAVKKAGREARQGMIETYIHSGNRIAALVEINCETDFVARTDDFRAIARDIAMQVVAMNPTYVSVDEITDAAREAGIKDHGDEKRFIEATVLMAQPFFKDPRRSIEDLIKGGIAKMGENIIVRRFTRYEVGEVLSGETTGETEE